MILALLLILLSAVPAWSQSIINLPGDPGSGAGPGSTMGFSRAHWIAALGAKIEWLGPGHDCGIRALDPVKGALGGSGAWTVIYPSASPCAGANWRDNYSSFYVPARDELWVFGGSHMEDLSNLPQPPYQSARYSLAGCHPISTNCATLIERNVSNSGSFDAIVENGITLANIDPGCAWSAAANAGICIAGLLNGQVVDNSYILIEPNDASSTCSPKQQTAKPYVSCVVDPSDSDPTFPSPRAQMMNSAIAGPNKLVYVSGGYSGAVDNVDQFVTDFWQYNFADHHWTKLATPPGVAKAGTITYDSDRNTVLMYARDHLYEYTISTNAWANVTPSGLPCVFNQTAVYATTAALHIFEGGNDCSAGDISYNHVWGINVGGGFYLPPKVWVAYPYSAWPDHAPVKGFGGIAQSKHLNIAENPDNGKIYFSGGDWSGNDGDNTGVWVWDPLVHAAGNQTGAMVHEHSNCGVQGEVVPGGPNESGFVWDSTRKRFIQLPGFWFLEQSGASSCGGGGQSGQAWNVASPLVLSGYAAYFAYNVNGTRYLPGVNFTVATDTPGSGQITLTNVDIPTGGANAACGAPICVYWQTNGNALQLSTIMAYDPVAKTWSNPNYPRETGYNELPKNAVYDPATDSIWRVGLQTNNVTFSRLHLDTGTWDYYQRPCAIGPPTGPCAGIGQTYINGSNMLFEWITADLVRRKLYVIDPIQFLLLEFDMDTTSVTVKANPPLMSTSYCHNSGTCKDFTELFWDAAHNVLLFPLISSNNDANVVLLIWHPDTNTWEQDAMYAPFTPTDSFGRTVKADNFAFSKVNNFLMAVGGGWNPGAGDNDPTLTQYHLYRYSAGSQTNGNRVLTIAASGSTQSVAVTVSPADANGQSNGTTQLIRRYDSGVAVSVVAPGTSGSSTFGGWLGCDSTTTTTVTNDTCHVTMTVSKAVTATYSGGTPTFSLNVTTSPDTGAGISYAVNSGSCTSTSPGTTPFARTCDLNSSVTLTAPGSYAGNTFSAWSGCDSASNTACTVTMNANKSVTANYVAQVVPYTLTINSSLAAAFTVSLADTNGNSDCTAPCTRIYNSGNSVTVTAPLISGDGSYTLWSGCSSLSGAACTVAMTGNKTITAGYVSGNVYQLSRDFSNVQGQRGWTYRDSAGASMTFSGGVWTGAEQFLSLSPTGAHPGATKDAVLRWTAPTTANIHITGNVHDGDGGGGDGVAVSIKLNGSTTLFSATISNGDMTGSNYDITRVVSVGDTIDFVTNARSNTSFDTTIFDPVISVEQPGGAMTIKLGASQTVKIGSGAVFKAGVSPQ